MSQSHDGPSILPWFRSPYIRPKPLRVIAILPLLADLVRYCLCALSNAPLRDCPLAAPAFYRIRCAYFLNGELLWDAAFGSNFGEQLWGMTVGSNFAALQQHWRIIFEERQLWGVALGSSFGKQLSATTLGGSFRSFGEQLFGAAFDNNFGTRLWGTALWSSFGKQKQLGGVALRGNLEQKLWKSAILWGSSGD